MEVAGAASKIPSPPPNPHDSAAELPDTDQITPAPMTQAVLEAPAPGTPAPVIPAPEEEKVEEGMSAEEQKKEEDVSAAEITPADESSAPLTPPTVVRPVRRSKRARDAARKAASGSNSDVDLFETTIRMRGNKGIGSDVSSVYVESDVQSDAAKTSEENNGVLTESDIENVGVRKDTNAGALFLK